MIISQASLSQGQVVLAYEFTLDDSAAEKSVWKQGGPGTGRLFINGQLVGESQITSGSLDFGSFGVGQSYGSSVSTDFESPFKFTGTLEKVTVELQ